MGYRYWRKFSSLPACPSIHINLSRACWGCTRKKRLELRSSSVLWRADSCGVIGNEKRKSLSRFQPDLLGAWLDQNQQVCSRLHAVLSGNWERCSCHREQAGAFQKKTSYLFCWLGIFFGKRTFSFFDPFPPVLVASTHLYILGMFSFSSWLLYLAVIWAFWASAWLLGAIRPSWNNGFWGRWDPLSWHFAAGAFSLSFSGLNYEFLVQLLIR